MKAITVKFHGPTYARGSRFIARDGDGNRVTVSARPELNSEENRDAVVLALCRKMGWTGTLQRGSVSGITDDVYV